MAPTVHLTDPRVTLQANVEPFTLSVMGEEKTHTSTSVDLTVAYDLGHAQTALMDFDYAVRQVRDKIMSAWAGERASVARGSN